MTRFRTRRLGELLVEAGVLNSGQLKKMQEEQKKTGKQLVPLLIENKILDEEGLLEIIEEKLGIAYIDLFKHPIDSRVATSIPRAMAWNHGVIPVRERNGRLLLAMADPTDLLAMEDVSMVTNMEVEPLLASERAIKHALNQFFGLKDTTDQSFSGPPAPRASGDFLEPPSLRALPAQEGRDSLQIAETAAAEEDYGAEALVEAAPIVKVINSLIQEAVAQRASDIHIEPAETGLRVRMRVDGILQELISPPRETHHLLISRIKVMAGMNIAEKRLPQDGQITMTVDGHSVNIRVSTMPTVHGEKVALRLLERDRVILPLDSIGFSARNYAAYTRFIEHSHGIILLTGPTGCGKTTTLYSTLHHIYRPSLNIITVEDPVEYRLEGVNQTQINPKIGLTFAVCLRTILRQDPDIIMVGEMRDLETAEIGTRAALTGHLVFSTLHTNNASQAVIRLLEMGVPAFLVSASLVGVVAQRLVRVICPHCRVEYAPGSRERNVFAAAGISACPPLLYRGTGCRRCIEGYRGRTAIHEIQPITPEIRRLIASGTSAEALAEKTRQMGLKTLLQDGLERAEEGITTVDEVVRVAFGELAE